MALPPELLGGIDSKVTVGYNWQTGSLQNLQPEMLAIFARASGVVCSRFTKVNLETERGWAQSSTS